MASGHEARKQRPNQAMGGRSAMLLRLRWAGNERRQLHGISSQHRKPARYDTFYSCTKKSGLGGYIRPGSVIRLAVMSALCLSIDGKMSWVLGLMIPKPGCRSIIL